MSILPNDIWLHILQTGTKTRILDHKDLRSLAMVSPHFDQLSQDAALWAALLHRDYPWWSRYDEAPSKSIYQKWFETKARFVCWAEASAARDYSYRTKQSTIIKDSGFSFPLRDVVTQHLVEENTSSFSENPKRAINIKNDISQGSISRVKTLYYENKGYKSCKHCPLRKT